MYLFIILFFSFPLFADLIDELESKKGTLSPKKELEILNVSYDPTREFYEAYNVLFTKWWKEKTGQDLSVVQSHGGSGKQARAVISGLRADVVTLALSLDIDAIQKATKEIGENWQNRLPNHSAPYYSTLVFLVRKGNPKKILDWSDLVRKGVTVVAPDPKTSGGGKWIYMAALAYAQEHHLDHFLIDLYKNIPVLDTGARTATTTFIQRNLGDVLITWENEAFLTQEKVHHEEFEIVYPSMSLRAEPPVTWVSAVVDEKGTRDAAEFYLKYLYSKPAQELIAKYHFRPLDEEVAKKYEKKFPKIKLATIEDFGGWEKVQEIHFKNKGVFDHIYLEAEKGK